MCLIHWKGKAPTEDTWLDRGDLRLIDPDALELYESASTPNSTGSSFLPPMKNDADIKTKTRRVY